MKNLHIKIGKSLTAFMQDGQQKTKCLHALHEVRRLLLLEYGTFPPNFTLHYDEQLDSNAYAFQLEGFGSLVYEAESWDVQTEKDVFFERIIVHYERFLRKWYTKAPDLYIEEKIKDRPLVLEYGQGWVDIVESEAFFLDLQQLARDYSIELKEPPYWESDYVGEDQLMVYVYGKDHFVKKGLEKTKDALLQDVLLPILRMNRLRIQRH